MKGFFIATKLTIIYIVKVIAIKRLEWYNYNYTSRRAKLQN